MVCPSVSAMSAISDELRALLSSHNVPDELAAWLETNGISSVKNFALSVTSEAEIRTVLIPESRLVLTFGQKTAVASAWFTARGQLPSLTAPSSSSSSSQGVPQNCPDGVEEAMFKDWKSFYKFALHGGRLASKKVMGEIWRGLKSDPRQLPVIPVEKIRLRSSLFTFEQTGVLVTATALVPVGHEVQECTCHPELWLRIQAYFTCVCLCMFNTANWFTFETCEAFVHQLFFYIFLQTDSSTPGLPGLKVAYSQMLTTFADEIQNNGRTLEELIKEKGCWVHYWKDIPSASGRPAKVSAPGAELSGDTLPPSVLSAIQANTNMVRALQSKVDRKGAGKATRPAIANGGVGDGDGGGSAKFTKRTRARGGKQQARSVAVKKQ